MEVQNSIFKVSRDLTLIQLKVEPRFDGWYFVRIIPKNKSKLDESGALLFSKIQFRETLFSHLNPTHYNFDYNRPIGIWKNYNDI